MSSAPQHFHQIAADMQHQLDTRAIEIASQTMGRLDQHLAAYEQSEKIRHEERRQQNEALAEVRADVKGGFASLAEQVRSLEQAFSTRWLRVLMWMVVVLGGALVSVVTWVFLNGPPTS